MREIKFKGWDGKKMTREYTLYEMLSFQLPNNGLKHNWLQYTGLKDKNDKDIFEGDIICNNNANWEVGFDEGGYWMRQQEGQHKFIFINEAQHSEVIGNLYENPKLLDK